MSMTTTTSSSNQRHGILDELAALQGVIQDLTVRADALERRLEETACPSWCRRHVPADAPGELASHFHDIGSVMVHSSGDATPVISLRHNIDDELTVGQARQVAIDLAKALKVIETS